MDSNKPLNMNKFFGENYFKKSSPLETSGNFEQSQLQTQSFIEDIETALAPLKSEVKLLEDDNQSQNKIIQNISSSFDQLVSSANKLSISTEKVVTILSEDIMQREKNAKEEERIFSKETQRQRRKTKKLSAEELGREADKLNASLGIGATGAAVAGLAAAAASVIDDGGGNPGSAPTNIGNDLFELIAGGEGGYNSVNRGNAGDTPGGAKAIFGKNLTEMTVGEIINAQRNKQVFAVGKYQIIPDTMTGFVNKMRISKDDKFDKNTQEKFKEYVITYKRPLVGKYLRGESNNKVEAAQELAREFASIGLSYPENGRRKGESRYAGTAGNAASISPEAVQAALEKERQKMSGDRNKNQSSSQSRSSSTTSSQPQASSATPASDTKVASASPGMNSEMNTKEITMSDVGLKIENGIPESAISPSPRIQMPIMPTPQTPSLQMLPVPQLAQAGKVNPASIGSANNYSSPQLIRDPANIQSILSASARGVFLNA